MASAPAEAICVLGSPFVARSASSRDRRAPARPELHGTAEHQLGQSFTCEVKPIRIPSCRAQEVCDTEVTENHRGSAHESLRSAVGRERRTQGRAGAIVGRKTPKTRPRLNRRELPRVHADDSFPRERLEAGSRCESRRRRDDRSNAAERTESGRRLAHRAVCRVVRLIRERLAMHGTCGTRS